MRDDCTRVKFLAVLIALAGIGASYQLLGVIRDRRRPRTGALLDAGGHRLYVDCRGDGTPAVIFESGIAASSLSWATVQPEIARLTRACSYDRAGLGSSDAPATPRTFDRIVDDLEAIVAHVSGGGPAVLVGHSFGALIVRAYAARRPQHVAALVLVDPPTEWLTITPPRARMLRGARFLSTVGALLARLGVVRACLALLTGGAPGAPRRFVRVFGPTAARTLERLVGEVRKLPPDVHPFVQAAWCQPKCFHAMAAYLRALERDQAVISACLPPPEIPISVISSAQQSADQIADQRALASTSRAGRHLVAAESGHWILFDEPEIIVQTLRELVEAHRGGFGPVHDTAV